MVNYVLFLIYKNSVNTQTRGHAQIHNHAQISAYVQLPALFQPRVLSQLSTHLHCDQAPYLATISTDCLLSAEMTLIIRRPCIISVDGNGAATLDLLSLYTLATGSQLYQKDCSPSSIPFLVRTLFPHPFLF